MFRDTKKKKEEEVWWYNFKTRAEDECKKYTKVIFLDDMASKNLVVSHIGFGKNQLSLVGCVGHHQDFKV